MYGRRPFRLFNEIQNRCACACDGEPPQVGRTRSCPILVDSPLSFLLFLFLSLSRNVPSRAPGLPGAQTLIHAPSGPNKDGPGRHLLLLLLFQGTEYNNHQRQQQPEINGVPTNDRGKSRMCSKTSKEIKSAGEWPTWRVAQKSFSPCHSLGWLVEDRVVLGKIKTCALYLIINTHTHTTGWWEGNNTKGGGEDSKSRFCGAINRPPIFSLLSRTLSPQQVTMAINRREGLQHLKTLGQFERAKTCLERFLLFVGAKWKSFKAKKKKIFSRNSRRSGVEKTFVIGPQNGVGRCLVTDLRAVMYGQS